MGDYRLVRVGVSGELWRILQEKESKTVEIPPQGKKKIRFPRIRARRLERMAKELAQRRRTEEAGIRRKFLQEILEDRNHSSLVAEEPVPFLEGWSFRGYLEEEWVLHMMKYAAFYHFVILGEAPCIPILLLGYVRSMKSLRWFLTDRQFQEAQEELVEDIYEEYGLAVEVHLLGEEKELRRQWLNCPFPVVIIDFCGEEKISTADVAKNSIWLDMTASEVKRHRLEDRNTQIAYFSLKKEWKQPQKARNYLDTISKNRYNT